MLRLPLPSCSTSSRSVPDPTGGLPPQRLELLLLHPGVVLLLAPTPVLQPVLQSQVDDPRQLVRRRGQCRLDPQPPFHPPQEPAQAPWLWCRLRAAERNASAARFTPDAYVCQPV